jgi:anti-sigma-K factor RskA
MTESQEESAALFALELLEGAERASFAAEIARDPALAREAHALREAAAALAYCAGDVEPPEQLRKRILASAGGAKTVRRSAFPSFIPWALAAGFAALSLSLAGVYWTQHSALRLLAEQRELAEVNLRIARDQMEGERILNERTLGDTSRRLADMEREMRSAGDLGRLKIARLGSMPGNSPAALAVAVWDADRQQGMLEVSKLPAAAADRDYQLWVIDPHYASPVSGGVFHVDSSTGSARMHFHADKPIQLASKFAVSIERKGGSSGGPQGPIVLISD